MKPVTGSSKQEMKISELGEIANTMFPDIKIMLFKGAFRHGIKAALEKKQIKSWDDVSEQIADERRKFFHMALDESVPHLNYIGLTEDQIKKLLLVLKVRNEKYLIK